MLTQTELKVAHLYRRAGFGLPIWEVKAKAKHGLDACIAEVVDFEAFPAPPAEPEIEDDQGRLPELVGRWLRRMLTTRRPLQEKLAFFWHGHFATSIQKVRSPLLMERQIKFLRYAGAGKFGELLLGMTTDPAMLLWLDGNNSSKGKPNENYAREVFELFGLGIGNYTEQDIKEAARALTGWRVNRLNGEAYIDERQFDDGTKTIFGKTGAYNAEGVIRLIMEHPANAKYIVRKLAHFFATQRATDQELAPFVAVYRKTQGDIRAVLRAMFNSEWFYSPKVVGEMVKSPTEFVVGTIKLLGLSEMPPGFARSLQGMGQTLYAPPTVKGWDGGDTWLSTSYMLNRFNFVTQLGQIAERRGFGLGILDAAYDLGIKDSAGWVDYLSSALLQRPISQQTREILSQYMGGKADAARQVGLLQLILTSPEYQLC